MLWGTGAANTMHSVCALTPMLRVPAGRRGVSGLDCAWAYRWRGLPHFQWHGYYHTRACLCKVHYGMAGDWPLELLVTVTFEEAGGETRLTLRHEGLPVGEQREMAGAG